MKTIYSMLLLTAILFLTSCEVDGGENIYSEVDFSVCLPDSAQIAILRIDYTLEGTFLRNINTRHEYTLPAFINNRCHIRLRKGIYVLSFDGTATLADGTVRRVRFAGHSVNRDALSLTGDYETILLNLAYLPQ